MSLPYYQIKQGVNVIPTIRAFLTNSNLGWVESNYSSGSSTELLIKTADTNQSENGVLYLKYISGSPDKLEIHGFRSGYFPDFNDPSDYLPGGANYDADEDYYGGTYPTEFNIQQPCDLYMAGDGGKFICGVINAEGNDIIIAGLFNDEANEFNWFQATRSYGKFAKKVAGVIQRGANLGNWIRPHVDATFDGYSGSSFFKDFASLNMINSRRIFPVYFLTKITNQKRLFLITYLYITHKDLEIGDELNVSGEKYLVIFKGQYICACIKEGTQIT